MSPALPRHISDVTVRQVAREAIQGETHVIRHQNRKKLQDILKARAEFTGTAMDFVVQILQDTLDNHVKQRAAYILSDVQTAENTLRQAKRPPRQNFVDHRKHNL